MINRKQFLGLFAAQALTATLSTAQAQGKTVIRFSSPSPMNDPLLRAMQMFKEEVEKKIPEVEVQLFPANQLFRQGTEVPALQRGNLEMGTFNVPELAQRLPEFGFFNRAFAFDDYPAFENAFSGRAGRALQQAALERLGIVMLASSYMGARQIALRTDRTVNNPSDLAGLKLRVPGAPDWIAMGKALGASATPMGLPDVYLAMQSGAIDAVENPISIIHSTKHDELMKQLVLTSHMVMTVHFSIAKTVFDKFTPAQQDVIREAAARAAAWNTQERLASEKTQIEEYKRKGVKITKPDLAAFKANASKIYASEDFVKAWDKTLMKEIGLAQ